MKWVAMLAAMLVLVSAWAPAQEPSGLQPGVVLLARVKQKVVSMLEHLPDYTCRMDLEQSRRRASEPAYRLLDRLELEVANIAGKELYMKRGGKEFSDRTPGQLGGIGASLTGDFAIHLRAIFLGERSVIRYAGPERLNGVDAERFEYEVSELTNPISMSDGKNTIDLPSRGSFWADPRTFEILRLELQLDKIPEHAGLTSGTSTVEYAATVVDGVTIGLPQRAECVVVDAKGTALRTRTEYSECRRYSGVSSLSFGDTEEPAKPK